MSERHVRPPEKVHRAFVQTKQSPAQKKRDAEAEEAAEYAAHQARLKAEMYARREKAA